MKHIMLRAIFQFDFFQMLNLFVTLINISLLNGAETVLDMEGAKPENKI